MIPYRNRNYSPLAGILERARQNRNMELRRMRDRVTNPDGPAYSDPQQFKDEAAKLGNQPGQPGWFGQGGPPGGMERVGYSMVGPQGRSLGANGPVNWQSTVQANQGPLQWEGIPQSGWQEGRPNTQPVPPNANIQQAQADLLRTRNS